MPPEKKCRSSDCKSFSTAPISAPNSKQALVLGDHFLFDLGERELFRRPLTLGLNQAAADDTGHATPPRANAGEKSTPCAFGPQGFGSRVRHFVATGEPIDR